MYLPQDLVTSILVRLPAESLVRFKCVCKTWQAIIDNPLFMDQRLKTMNGVSSNDNLFLVYSSYTRVPLHRVPPDGVSWMYTPFAPVPSIVTFLLSEQSTELMDLNGAPCVIYEQGNTSRPVLPEICGPINGVYCIIAKRSNTDVRSIMFWNPGNGHVHVLPPIPCPVLPDDLELRRFYGGFGHDPSSNDYKVVCISEYGEYFYQENYFCLLHVYSLASNSWHPLNPHQIAGPSVFILYDDGRAWLMQVLNHAYAFSSGNACHWLFILYCEDYEPDIWMMSFDFVDHVFRVTSASSKILGGTPETFTIVDGCLGLVCRVVDEFSALDNGTSMFNIGVMKESWTIAYKMSFNEYNTFLGIVGDEFFVQDEDGFVVSYCLGDPKQECRDYCYVDIDNPFILSFKGSLVPIKPRTEHNARH